MKTIRPREMRLFMDDARTMFTINPLVLKVTDRRIIGNGKEEMDITMYTIKNFDMEFANNFFYRNDTGKEPTIRMMMVPFALNGDE